MARILIVSQYYSPDITAAAHRITDLRQFLQSKGHEVDVITSFPHKAQVELTIEADDGIARVKLPRGATSTVVRLWEQFLFSTKALAAYVRRFRNNRYEFVIASSPPLFVGLAGHILAKWTGAKFILDIRDIWPGSVAAAGVADASSLPIRIASRLERWLYRVADHITCVSRPMQEYLQQFAEDGKVRVVYNGVNICATGEQGEDSLDTRARLGAPDNDETGVDDPKRTVCIAYAGNIGLVQDIHVLVEALDHVQPDTLRRLRVRIIGSGPERSRLETMVAENPIASKIISFEGPYPKDKLNELLSSSVDALFIHLRSDPVLDRTIPSKVFDSCLLNLPIVYGLSGEGHEILSRLSGTLSFRQGSARSLATALDELVQQYRTYLIGAQTHRTFVEKHFTREACFRLLLDFIV